MLYREFRPRAELSELVACTWEREVPNVDASAATRVLPDGCVDLIWHGGGLVVAGPDRGPFLSPPRPGATIVGIRLRPGAAGLVLGLPASELHDTRVPLEAVWGHRGTELTEEVADAGSPPHRRGRLERIVHEQLTRVGEPDSLVLAATRRLGLPGSRVGSLTRAFGHQRAPASAPPSTPRSDTAPRRWIACCDSSASWRTRARHRTATRGSLGWPRTRGTPTRPT